MEQKEKKTRVKLWLLVGIVLGMIFIGWALMLPRQFSQTTFHFDGGALKEELSEEASTLEAIKARANEYIERFKQGPDMDTPNETGLTNAEIRDLQHRVFDDPLE